MNSIAELVAARFGEGEHVRVKPVAMDIDIDLVETGGGTQMRVRYDDDTVREYAERILAGDAFPPVVLFQERNEWGKTVYWLADGFHRLRAHRVNSAKSVRALVHQGGKSEAIEHAIGANKSNGLRRTNADKQMAVRAALAHERLRELSDRQIAEIVGVAHETVRTMRSGLVPQVSKFDTCNEPTVTTRVGKDGKSYRLPGKSRNGSAPSRPSKSVSKPASRAVEQAESNRAAPEVATPRRAALLASESIPCPHCNGTGRISGGR